MSQSEKTVGAVGEIHIDALAITVTPLSQSEEMALDRELRRAAEAAAGDHYTRCKPLLDAMTAAGAHGDRVEAVREMVRLSATKTPLSSAAFFEFRASPAGLATELFARGKKATAGLTKPMLEAVITEVNADAIAAKLYELLQGDDHKS
jgi:hypothetical protein